MTLASSPDGGAQPATPIAPDEIVRFPCSFRGASANRTYYYRVGCGTYASLTCCNNERLVSAVRLQALQKHVLLQLYLYKYRPRIALIVSTGLNVMGR